MLEFDLLRLRDSESAADVGKRFLRQHDRARAHRANLADELDVFDRFGEEFQTAAILFEKTQSRAIDLAIDQQTNEAFVAEARGEVEFALGDVESGFSFAERLIAQ